MARLVCENVGKAYQEFELKNISLTVESGYLTGLLGLNGAGKSTLLRILAGVDPLFTGTVTVDGTDVSAQPAEAKQKIGFVSEERQFFWELDALENGELLGQLYPDFDQVQFQGWLQGMGIPINQPLYQFSKGMKMKFQLGFVLSYHPQFLLLDEPTSGLDPIFRRDFLKILRDVLDLGMGILMTTHLMSDLDRIADVVVVLDHGEQKLNEHSDALEKGAGAEIEALLTGKFRIRDLLEKYGETV